MADNSLQGGTDSIRDIDRSGTGPKTQVFQLDHAGAGASESLTSTANPLPSYRPDQSTSGSIAALNATVALALNGVSAMRVQITGTWVGTLQFEGTVDGTNWIAVNAVQAGSTTIPQTTTGNGMFSPTPAGFSSFRVNATAWTSGTATVSIRGSIGTGGVYFNQNLPAFSVIPAFKIDQTTPGTTNLVSIGTTGTVAINAALPTGANVIGGITAAQLPASLGAKTNALSLAVAQATDAYALQPASSTSLMLAATATTNATLVKAAAGAIKGINGANLKTSAVYLKLYNKATAPTVGTDVPVKTIYLPASSAFVFDFTEGYAFATGIAYALTLAAANADATALVAGDIVALNVDYL